MEIAYNSKEANKFYQEVKSIRKGFTNFTKQRGNTVSNKEKVLQRWSEYFEKTFESQDGLDGDSVVVQTICIQTAEPYVERPHDEETEIAISKLKYGKETGHHQTLAKLITRRKRAQESHSWIHFKNTGGRDQTTGVEIWHSMSNS